MRPPLRQRGLFCFGITEAPAAQLRRCGITEAPSAAVRGPPPLWEHRGPGRGGEGAPCSLGTLRPPPLRRGGFRFGTTEAPAAETRAGLFSLGAPRPPPLGRGGLLCLGEAPSADRLPRPPPLRRGGLRRFGITEAPAAEAGGPLALWDQRGPRR